LTYQAERVHRVHSAYWWSFPWETGGIDPLILNFGTRWKWMASFTPRLFHLWGNGARYPWTRRMDWTESLSRRFRQENIHCFCPEPNHDLSVVQPVAWTLYQPSCPSFPAALCVLRGERLLWAWISWPPWSLPFRNFSCLSRLSHCTGGCASPRRAAYSLCQGTLFWKRKRAVSPQEVRQYPVQVTFHKVAKNCA
jgi:hypothetical protein